MEYGQLGTSGLKVSKIIFGGMSIGSKKWQNWVLEEEEALTLLKYAYDQGIRTIDTANVYSFGISEEIIGKFLKINNIDRKSVVILTKCFFPTNFNWSGKVSAAEYANLGGLSRRAIFDSVEDSVKRLGTYIDVLQIHRADKYVSKEETMKALHDVVESGKVRYIGASSMRTYEFVEYQHVAETNGWTKFISMQNYHNAVYREEEREMIPYCKKTGVGLIPWSPIARGVLARPYAVPAGTVRSTGDTFKVDISDSDKKIIDRVEELAKKKGVTMAQISIAWSLAKGDFPIVGLSSAKRIDEAVAAVKVELTPEEIKYIDEPYQAHEIFGLIEEIN